MNKKSNLSLSDFDKEIKIAMMNYAKETEGESSFKFLRPFISKGDPRSCDVLIIGLNPATPIAGIFEMFWDPKKHGFRREEFYEFYSKNRNKKGTSRTRKRIETITKSLEADNYSVVETNLFAWPTSSGKKLTAAHKNAKTNILDTILRNIEWKLIVAHGSKPKKAFSKSGHQAVLLKKHFSLFSDHETEELIKTIKSKLRAK